MLTRSTRVWLLGLLVLGLGVVPGRAEWRRSYNTSCDCNGAPSYAPQVYYPPAPVYAPPPPPAFAPPQNTATYTPPAAMPSAPVASATPPGTSRYTPQVNDPPASEIALAQPDSPVPIYNPPTPVRPGPPLAMPPPTDSTTAFASPGCCSDGSCDGTCCYPVCEVTSHPGLIARIKAKKAAKACCACDPCCCTTAKCHPLLDKIRAKHEAKKYGGDCCGEKKHLFKCFHKKDSCPPPCCEPVYCCPGQ